MKNSLFALRIACIPVLAFVLLRWTVRHALGIKLGFTYGTDYDFVPHMLVASSVYLMVLHRDQPIEPKLQKRNAAISAILIVATLLSAALGRPWISYQFPMVVGSWFFLCFSAIASTAFLFVPVAYFFQSRRRILLLPTLLVGLSGIISLTLLEPLWDPMALLTGKVTYVVLGVLFPDLTYEWRELTGHSGPVFYTMLSHPSYSIAVGRGCGGMQGMSLFGFLWGLLYIITPKALSGFQWLLFTAAGIVLMFALNIFRLFLFFSVCLVLFEWQGVQPIAWYTSFFFHALLGWLIYIPGIIAFVRTALPKAGSGAVHKGRPRIWRARPAPQT